MIIPPRGRRQLTATLLICIVFAFLTFHIRTRASFYRTPSSANIRPAHNGGGPRPNAPEPTDSLVRFWRDLLDALVKCKPEVTPIKLEKAPAAEITDPKLIKDEGPPKERYEAISLSAIDREGFKKSHAEFVRLAKDLGPRLPYTKHSRGIVMTAGGKYIGNAILSILMLRRTGSELPIQLFLDSADDYNHELCESTLLELNVECRSMQDVWKTTPSMPKLEKFQFKIFAILFSTYEDVLFLDADCFPIHNVDHLFDVDPYKTTGLVTWPDLWLSTVSPSFYDIVGIEAPAVEMRRSSESGIILYSRSKHADSALMAAYYNFYGPQFYYPLLCQSAPGEGDKETFMHGAMAVGKPFYDVRTHMGFLGRWINGTYETAGMVQADPMEDFEMRGRRANKVTPHALFRESDLKARAMFIHHNLVKLDMNNLAESMTSAFRLNEEGKMQRLWGDQKDLTESSGYDVEKAMWEEIIRVDCHQSFLKDCSVVRKFYEAMFVEKKS